MTLATDFDPMKGKMLQILDKTGKVINKKLEPKLSKQDLLKIYKLMALARRADDKRLKMQRTGRMGTFAESKGQEAAQVPVVMQLTKKDWLVPSFRELPAQITFGLPIENDYLYYMGNEKGMQQIPKDLNMAPISVPVGTQTLHAVGIAWAEKLKKTKNVTVCYFGDGGTSEGDFHEAMNFAGVFKTPVVFICQNNQYAISVPREKQTASKTIAQKAIGYGMEGIQVDGNDPLAMYVAGKYAIEKARKGGGSTLIEAYTYRLANHTTADDATKYRTEKEVKEWEKKDPILRWTTYLKAKKAITDKFIKETDEWVEQEVARATKAAEETPKISIDDIFDYTYETTPQYLEEQKQEVKKYYPE